MKYYNLLWCILIPFFLMAQNNGGQKIVKGRIVDAATGKLMVGASLQMKLSGRHSYSGYDGLFSVSASYLPDSLIVTFVGYQKLTIPISETTVFLELQMRAEAGMLQEVNVYTGYQVIPKERATGSFSTVDLKTFNEQVGRNVLDRLEAVANGFSVDKYTGVSSGTQNMMVRGQTTILGVKGPLIVVDNFPYNGDLKNINPNDVENITILRDAAAASIWGTKAGNGVIVITTKKGRFNQPVGVDFNSSISFTAKPDLFSLPQMSSGDYIDLEQNLFDKKYKVGDVSNINQPPFSPVYEILFNKLNGVISKETAQMQIDSYRGNDYRSDLNKYFYQTAIGQQYALSARGGSAAYSWLFSAGYDQNISALAAKDNRLTLQLDNTWKASDRLQINASLYLTKSTAGNGKPGYFDLKTANGNLPPYTRLVDGFGQKLAVIKDYRQSFLDGISSNKLLDWNYYPLDDYTHNVVENKLFDVTGNLGLTYKVSSFLGVDLKYQYERQQNDGKTVYDIDSYFTRNLVNRFTYTDPLTNDVNYRVPRGAIADFSNNLLQSQQLRAQINYNQSIGKHGITAILGSEIRQIERPEANFRAYGYNPLTLSSGNVDYVSFYPTILPQGQVDQIPNPMYFNKSMNRFISFYGNAAYTYDEKYTFSLSGRRDASNLFGVNTNEKWTPLWSAGLAYHLSKAAFYSIEAVPYLKLRGSYGFSGNADPSRVALTTITYSPWTNENTQTQYAYVSRYGNPELKWEKIRTINFGLDFEIRNSRLRGSIEYYQKKGTDLFGAARIDYTTGITSGLTKNVASMSGSGVDINLNSQNLKGSIRWNTVLNFSTNTGKVTSYDQKIQKGSDYISSSPLISALVGKPVYAMFSFKWKGLDPATGDPLGYINGHVSKNYAAIYGDSTKLTDLVYHGSVMPTLFGSIGNDFSWRGISLSVRLMYKFGYYFRRPSLNYSRLFELRQGDPEFASRWQKRGDERFTNVPSLIYPADNNRDLFYNGAEINVEKGDHIRLQYITAGYEFEEHILKKLAFKSLQLYASLSNIGVLWRANKKGLDPDYASGQNLVPSKTISFGLRVGL